MRRFSSVPCDKLCLGSGLVGAPEVYAADGFVCALCVCVLSLELVFPGACRLFFRLHLSSCYVCAFFCVHVFFLVFCG